MAAGQNTVPSTGLKAPWAPGQSGNPGGRPALPAEFKARGIDALLKLVDHMASENEAISLRAAEIVADKVYGKSTQPMEHAGAELLDLVAERVAGRMNGHTPDPDEVRGSSGVTR